MKKFCTLFAALLLLTCMNIHAQTEGNTEFSKKGTYLFNPQLLNLAYSNVGLKTPGSDESTTMSQMGLAVSGGYAIEDGLFIIGQVGAQAFKFGEMKLSFASLGGGARYYLPNNFYAGAGLLINHGTVDLAGGTDFEDADFEDVSAELGTTMVEVHIEAGYSYFLIPGVALEPSVSYGAKILGGKIENYDGNLNYNRFGINLGVSVFF